MKNSLLSLGTFYGADIILQDLNIPNTANNGELIKIIVSAFIALIAPIIKDMANAKIQAWRKKKGLPIKDNK
jgi:hypothetical protein